MQHFRLSRWRHGGHCRLSVFTLCWRSIASRVRHGYCRGAAQVVGAVIQLRSTTWNPNRTFPARCNELSSSGRRLRDVRIRAILNQYRSKWDGALHWSLPSVLDALPQNSIVAQKLTNPPLRRWSIWGHHATFRAVCSWMRFHLVLVFRI